MRFLALLVASLAACTPSGDNGHAHGPEGGHSHETDGLPMLEVTKRLDSTEIFVKYPALLTGSLVTFETYVTKLDSYQPVEGLSVTVSLIRDGKGIRHTVDSPNKNGVYLPALRPTQTGLHRLVMELTKQGFEEKLELGEIQVYENAQKLQAVLGPVHDDDEGISFTKKQSWDITFQSEPVIENAIFEVISTSGTWEAAPGDSKSLAANASGIVNFNRNLLTEGVLVKKGQPLMTITSRGLTNDNLEVEIEKAKADHNQIAAEYERQKILYESDLIPRAEFERSESKYLVSKASIESLQEGYIEGGKQITVPFDGFVKSIDIHNGDYVAQGTELFSVIALNSQILETQVNPSHGLTPENIEDIWYKQPNGEWSSMKQSGGTVLSIGYEVSEEEPLLPVFAKVNTPVRMPPGSFTEVKIGIGTGNQTLVIPESALLEDYGNYSVMVQIRGEAYEKRTVEIGKRNGIMAEVISGLQKDEIVVTKGAYQVKMASMSSSVPGHGHEH